MLFKFVSALLAWRRIRGGLFYLLVELAKFALWVFGGTVIGSVPARVVPCLFFGRKLELAIN
jgi:hypothetical protein